MEWEANFLIWLQQFRTPLMAVLWKNISYAGLALLFIPLVILLFNKKGRIVSALMLLSGVPTFIIFGVIIKAIINRARPYMAWPAVNPVLHAMDASFPSGHTMISFILAFFYLKYLPKKVGIPSMILAALIAISRLVLGVHYPTDILAGLVIAWLCFVVGEKYIFPWLKNKKQSWTWL